MTIAPRYVDHISHFFLQKNINQNKLLNIYLINIKNKINLKERILNKMNNYIDTLNETNN